MNKTVLFLGPGRWPRAHGPGAGDASRGVPHPAAAAPPHIATPVAAYAPSSAYTSGARRRHGSLTMTSRLSHPYIPAGSSDEFVTVDVTGAEVPGAQRSPVNLALVIDRSGSMSGYKLAQAKQAARQLVNAAARRGPAGHRPLRLGREERCRAWRPRPSNRERMLQYIDGIWDEGGTNISAGLSDGPHQVNTAQRRVQGQPHHPHQRRPAHRGRHGRAGPEAGGEEHPRAGGDGELHRRGHGLQRGPDAGVRRVRRGRVRLPGGRGQAGQHLPEGPAAGDHAGGAQRGAVLRAARGVRRWARCWATARTRPGARCAWRCRTSPRARRSAWWRGCG